MGRYDFTFEFIRAVCLVFILPGATIAVFFLAVFRAYTRMQARKWINDQVTKASVELSKDDETLLVVEAFRHEHPTAHGERTEIVDRPFTGNLGEPRGSRGRHRLRPHRQGDVDGRKAG